MADNDGWNVFQILFIVFPLICCYVCIFGCIYLYCYIRDGIQKSKVVYQTPQPGVQPMITTSTNPYAGQPPQFRPVMPGGQTPSPTQPTRPRIQRSYPTQQSSPNQSPKRKEMDDDDGLNQPAKRFSPTRPPPPMAPGSQSPKRKEMDDDDGLNQPAKRFSPSRRAPPPPPPPIAPGAAQQTRQSRPIARGVRRIYTRSPKRKLEETDADDGTTQPNKRFSPTRPAPPLIAPRVAPIAYPSSQQIRQSRPITRGVRSIVRSETPSPKRKAGDDRSAQSSKRFSPTRPPPPMGSAFPTNQPNKPLSPTRPAPSPPSMAPAVQGNQPNKPLSPSRRAPPPPPPPSPPPPLPMAPVVQATQARRPLSPTRPAPPPPLMAPAVQGNQPNRPLSPTRPAPAIPPPPEQPETDETDSLRSN